jgi:superfamily II DNA or RNA helicase
MNSISEKGYIYVRNHISYNYYNACKLGKTQDIIERDNVYSCGEIERGNFYPVFEMELNKIHLIETLLKNEFQNYNIKYDAGTEFYDKEIKKLIEPYIEKININYRKLTNEEIINIHRKHRIKNNIKKLKKCVKLIINSNKIQPREEQKIIIKNSVEYLRINDKGLLILMCGVGKTLISLWVTKELKYNKILIGVPNILLLKQWQKSVKMIFKNYPILCVCKDKTVEDIINFLEKNSEKCVIITTYSSCFKVNEVSKISDKYMFDIKINDEVHHLTGINIHDNKNYLKILEIKTKKQISLTATLKLLESENDICISNDNLEYFGDIIDKKDLYWAINKNILCDYVVQTIVNEQENLEEHLFSLNIIEDIDKRLFFSAFATLKSIFENHSHHILIYANNKINANKIIKFINLLIENKYFDIDNLFYSSYYSELETKTKNKILSNFEKSKFGIISCVYCLNEGWDFPLLDAVVFSENMSSNIRILQAGSRGLRKNIKQLNKIAKIILPILLNDNFEDNDNEDNKKVKQVIYHMGLEDENITQKIRVHKINVEKEKIKHTEKEYNETYNDFGEYEDELTKKLRLKTIKRTLLNIPYEKVKKIIKEKNINSKKEYYLLCENDNRLTNEPEIFYKTQFKGWVDYLSIPNNFYDLETCKKKIEEYLIYKPELNENYLNLNEIVSQLTLLDKNFPPDDLWIDYYNIKNLNEIIILKNKKKKFGVII